MAYLFCCTIFSFKQCFPSLNVKLIDSLLLAVITGLLTWLQVKAVMIVHSYPHCTHSPVIPQCPTSDPLILLLSLIYKQAFLFYQLDYINSLYIVTALELDTYTVGETNTICQSLSVVTAIKLDIYRERN